MGIVTKTKGKRAMHYRDRYHKLIAGLAVILIGTLCLGRTEAKADDFSVMLGEQPDGTYGGMGVSGGDEYEVPGHWDLTDTLYLDPEEKEPTNGERTIRMSRDGEDPRILFFAFADAAGNDEVTYKLVPDRFNEKYYTENDYINTAMRIFPEPHQEDLEKIFFTMGLADLTFDETGSISSKENITYFTKGGTPINARQISDLQYDESVNVYTAASIEGKFEPGEAGGDKRYIIVEAWAPLVKEARFITVYEYTWADEPETLRTEVEYGVIEYVPTEESPSVDSGLTDIVQDVLPIPESADSTAGETIAVLLVIFVLPVLLIVAVIVIVVKIKKRSKKNGARKE